MALHQTPLRYRSRYLCPLATRRWCDPSGFVELASSSVCPFACIWSGCFFLPPSPLGRDNRRLGPSDPLCRLPTAAYACCALTTWQWHLRRMLACYSFGTHAYAAAGRPQAWADDGQEKVGGWAPMQGPPRFPRPQGRPQGTARRVWLIGRILNIPASMRPHILRPVVESQNPSRQARPPHTTDRNLPPWPVVKSVCRLPTRRLPISCRFCPFQNLPQAIQGPADPVRSGLPRMSTRATRD